MIDPLADWDIDIQSFDIPRMVSVYPDLIGKDEWLEEYFPSQMEAYHNAINQTREQLLKQSV